MKYKCIYSTMKPQTILYVSLRKHVWNIHMYISWNVDYAYIDKLRLCDMHQSAEDMSMDLWIYKTYVKLVMANHALRWSWERKKEGYKKQKPNHMRPHISFFCLSPSSNVFLVFFSEFSRWTTGQRKLIKGEEKEIWKPEKEATSF